ncbi:MAG: hypothetical protein OJF47_002019 [Nitrospira sp.]|nr:MAG: hypothetical protein OJF47_002019 [Nitrospira sp.]
MNVDDRSHESLRKGSQVVKPDSKVIRQELLRNTLIIPEHREKVESEVRRAAVISFH